jgi:hypothetical protein
MHPGTGSLARGEKSIQTRTPVQIGADPAHEIVCCRPDRNEIPGDVDAILQACGVDPGEAHIEVLGLQMAHIEKDSRIGRSAFADLDRDRARNDIARSKFGERVLIDHETLALVIEQEGAFATQRLGEQKRRRPNLVERRRMELHKLHIAEDRVGPPTHCDSVRGCDGWIGGVAVDVAGAAGSQENRRCMNNALRPELVDHR